MGSLLDLVDTSTALIALLVFLLSLVVTHRFYQNGDDSKSLPPRGPREWPVIGIIPSLVGDEPYKLLARMSPQYGPVFLTRIGMISTLIINDFDSMKEALVRSGDDFADRPKFGMMEYITKGKGIISAHVGDSQREKRRFGLAALRELGMGKSRLVENISDEIETLCDVFMRYEGKPFNPAHDITVSVSNIISWIVFGKRFKHNDTAFKRFLEIIHEGIEICESTGAAGFIPMLQYLPLPVWKKLADNDREWKEFDAVMIAEALQRPASEEPCFVQMYNEEMKRMEQRAKATAAGSKASDGTDGISASEETVIFNEEDMRQTLGDLFAAGTDTTATTLKWAILYLILYPDVQCKIHKELDNVFGHNRKPSLEDRKYIPYTEAVLLEVQRKATIVPLGVPHAASWDTKLNGHHIPAKTLILPNIWAVHHDPKIWKNPNEFQPERFLDDKGTTVLQREELIPFCIGRRKCLGEQLAKMELYYFFTHLLHRFEFRISEGALPPSTVGKPGATRNPMPFSVCAIPRFS
ncbi:cytochrome P450 2U1 [Strongylocentrotus purpuratus]|uniref:Cytochrome P450 n=1 Tax=Strongylocentrotus purpuratus TaxID=7668 RepID=A0A7M7RFE4_STRPU|nr:cytochrome P450 2U1 [Strongylocentrotus purpuratus]